MSTLFPDTHPEAEAVLIHLLRAAPPWRKLEMVAQISAAVKAMTLSGLRVSYPEDSPAMIRRRMAELLLGPDLAARAYGPLTEDENAG